MRRADGGVSRNERENLLPQAIRGVCPHRKHVISQGPPRVRRRSRAPHSLLANLHAFTLSQHPSSFVVQLRP